MAEQKEIKLPSLHPAQLRAKQVPGRFKVGRCGRRFGKTALAAEVVCSAVLDGQTWGFFAPDYKIMSETYREIEERLRPIISQSSKTDGLIRTITGGRVDFWTLNNPRAGRSRKYHGVIIDEAAFAEGDMEALWNQAIKPTLLDYGGVAWALSTPNGVDEENWFYRICTDKSLGWSEFHAPTASNPLLPREEISKLQRENSPEVYRQEYLAEFVDWSGVAFFGITNLLRDGEPYPVPERCDSVFAVVDTAIKDGVEHNSTGVVYIAYNSLLKEPFANGYILDWDIYQIDAPTQIEWVPSVIRRCEELARQCGARRGSGGVFIEDRATGPVLIKQFENEARRMGKPSMVHPLPSKLTAAGKDGRAMAAQPYVYRGRMGIASPAWSKVSVNKGRSANHLISQVTSYRMGDKKRDGLDLLDCFCYAVLICNGAEGGHVPAV